MAMNRFNLPKPPKPPKSQSPLMKLSWKALDNTGVVWHTTLLLRSEPQSGPFLKCTLIVTLRRFVWTL